MMVDLRLIMGGALILATGCYSGAQQSDSEDQNGSDSATGSATNDGDGADDGDTMGGGTPTCQVEAPSDRATLRRLTRFEYNNTVHDLFGDDTRPANAFPSEELGNGFGNDANAQSVSSLLVEQYNTVAEGIALRATETPAKLTTLAPCAADITDASDSATQDACATTIIESLMARAYRRPILPGEALELVELSAQMRDSADFATSIAGAIETILQSPHFLYRLEHGKLDSNGRLRPTGYEMASRLSYLLWGTMPDQELFDAAAAGELVDATSVAAHAERMIDDERSFVMIRFFFDNLLPISALAALERDPERYPEYSAAIGALMREETHQFMLHEIFEGPGTWYDALTAPYTLLNRPLAEFYGIEGVEGDEFTQVPLDTSQRLGLLTQAGIVAGTIHSNETNPVVRGAFLMRHLMCTEIPLPEGDVAAEVMPPDPDSGATARERYAQHSSDPVCAGCHSLMDPVGLTLENFDPIGRWRDTENDVMIDARGAVPGIQEVDGPVELVQTIADSPITHNCFVTQWINFGYGKTVTAADECNQKELQHNFEQSGTNIRQLLLDLTQSDEFLYLATQEN